MDSTQCTTDDVMNTLYLFCLFLQNNTHIVEKKNLKIFKNGNFGDSQDFPKVPSGSTD